MVLRRSTMVPTLRGKGRAGLSANSTIGYSIPDSSIRCQRRILPGSGLPDSNQVVRGNQDGSLPRPRSVRGSPMRGHTQMHAGAGRRNLRALDQGAICGGGSLLLSAVDPFTKRRAGLVAGMSAYSLPADGGA